MIAKTPQGLSEVTLVNNTLCEREDRKMVKTMSKLLRVPKKDILRSINLFSNIHPDLQICFHKLRKLEEKDYISAFMLLEYLLFFENGAMEIVED